MGGCKPAPFQSNMHIEIKAVEKPTIHIVEDINPYNATKTIIYWLRSPTTKQKYSCSFIITEEMIVFGKYKKIALLKRETEEKMKRVRDRGWYPDDDRRTNRMQCIYCTAFMSEKDYRRWRRPCPCLIRSRDMEKQLWGASIPS